MAVGIDFGTSIICVAKKDEEGKTISSSERNCFIDMGTDFLDIITSSDYDYVEGEESGEKKIYVIGKASIELDNLLSSKDEHGVRHANLRRPMKEMVINSKTDKKAIQMLKQISQGLLGPPDFDGEICVLSVPASSIDGKIKTTFHSNMCERFVSELGYTAVPINEALAVVYATNPKIEDPEGGTLNFTGIGMSFGGGGSNLGVAYKGKDTITLSVARGGDWIDEQVSSVVDLTSSQVTVLKEKASREGKLDLSDPDSMIEDENLTAIYIFYRNLIETVVKEFKKSFVKEGITFDQPLEVIISGGTSLPTGFDTLVEQVIKKANWPFDIKGVRRAKDPLTATAIGCLTAAVSRENKINSNVDVDNKNNENNE